MRFRAFIVSLACFSAVAVTSCRQSGYEKLESATRLAAERPDSAFGLLREIDYNSLSSDSLKARYALTKAMTNLRVGRSLITDTLLEDAAVYYLSAGDTANWVISSQLLSGHELYQGNGDAAVQRLEAVRSNLDNPTLLWDTYIHLFELTLNLQRFPEAYRYAAWLVNHTNVPEHIIKFQTAKAGSKYLNGETSEALSIMDSVRTSAVFEKVSPQIADEFMEEYALILDGAGQSAKALAIFDSLQKRSDDKSSDREIEFMISRAQCYANAGNPMKANQLLDSINHDATQGVFELYSYIAMLKAALQYQETGRIPGYFLTKVAKNIHRAHMRTLYDRQTALESVVELNDDNYNLKIERQRLWLVILVISIIVLITGVVVSIVLTRRKRKMVEAEERAETLTQMLKDMENAEKSKDNSPSESKLKAALLRQLGIFKAFAGTPNAQSIDALKRISTVGNGGKSPESIVDWNDFYAMIDNIFDGFHSKLTASYPDLFNDKEQQIIVLVKAGFSTKEIGVLTEQSSATIYTRKSVIRKKLQTPDDGDFTAQLDKLFQAS